MGIMMALEGEPPGEPDQRAARAHNRFSRLAGEGGRNGRMRATGPIWLFENHTRRHTWLAKPGFNRVREKVAGTAG